MSTVEVELKFVDQRGGLIGGMEVAWVEISNPRAHYSLQGDDLRPR
jgi:hypothetical protein